MLLSLFFFFFLLDSITGTCPKGTVSDPYSNKWKCLAFITPGKLYLTADGFCNDEYHGHLTSTENGFVNMYITENADTAFVNETAQRFWIGVNNVGGNGWTNMDGSNATFFNWAPSEPANSTGSNGCVSVSLKGTWYNDDCFTNYPYVCGVPEVDASPTTPSTETTTKVGTTTSTNNPLMPCWSYIPFAIDVSRALTSDKFSVMKDFIATYFIKELCPIGLQPATTAEYGRNSYFRDVQFNVSDMVTGFDSLGSMGVFNYKDGISVNSVLFAGNVSVTDYTFDLQYMINEMIEEGNTLTIVFVNPNLDLTVFQNLTNVNVVQWSDDPTELLTNIRKNMRCGGGEPVYRPCKRWFSLVPDCSPTLSDTDWRTQITFIQNEFDRVNRPDKVQTIDAYEMYFSGSIDWNHPDRTAFHWPDYYRRGNTTFSLNTSLQALSNTYYSKDRTEYQPPYTALVFIPTTDSYENYGGAEEIAQDLKDVGFQLTFFLMGPNVDESKLTNYTTNFVYWSDMRNPRPDNWEQVRLQAYGCNQITEF